jgi:uncharacterized phiE125 gp8 family phage protein
VFGLQVTTAPTVEPITLEEAKENLRFNGEYEADRIRALIKAARIYCERATGKAFITQTLKLTLDCWPTDGIIRLPRPPLQTVSSIKYDDYLNVEQTLSSTLYVVDAASEPGRIGVAYGQIWPDLYEELGSIRITYVAGYGATPATVPDTIKQAMYLLITHWFENREPVGQGQKIAFSVESLLGCESAGVLVGTYG